MNQLTNEKTKLTVIVNVEEIIVRLTYTNCSSSRELHCIFFLYCQKKGGFFFVGTHTLRRKKTIQKTTDYPILSYTEMIHSCTCYILHFAILTDSSWAIYVLSFSLLISQFLVCVLLLIKDISFRDNNRGIHRIQLLVVSPFILLMISAEMFKEFHDFWLYSCEIRKYNFKSKIGVLAVLFYTILYMCIILSMPIILTKAVLLVDVNNPFDILASFAGLVMLFKADTILYENLSLNETFMAVESGLPKSHKWKLLYTCIVIPITVLALFAAMATYYVDAGDDF
jgi:hypothetical protein